jgi:hypothetical protein
MCPVARHAWMRSYVHRAALRQNNEIGSPFDPLWRAAADDRQSRTAAVRLVHRVLQGNYWLQSDIAV